MAPQPPLPPEIEGFLKKLKRKTSNLTGSWNKRWFFVDPKRLEFGYAQSKAPNAPKSSIYLNDITAVLQFDDTHFQVESRTRNFFLCGESKASTTCWVKSLDEYRKKLIEYEKQLATLAASIPSSVSSPSSSSSSPVDGHSTANATSSSASNQARASDLAKRSSLAKKTKKPVDPARDSSHQDSSLSVSASSSSNLADEKTVRNGAMGEPSSLAALEEHRLPSPIEPPPRRHERRESKLKTQAAGSGDRVRDRERDTGERGESRDSRESRGRGRDKHDDRDDRDGDERERDRRGRDRGTKERDRNRDRDADDERGSQRDRSTSAQRRAGSGKGATASGSGSSSRTSSGRGVGARQNGTSASSAASHPHGYVMHAWMDEYD